MGGSTSGSSPLQVCTGGTPSGLPSPASNQMAAYQSTCQGSINTPVVTLSVCIPNTSTCQSIPNILVDYGSSGLRLSHSVSITSSLPQETLSGQSLFECFSFVSGYNYGPVVTAQVTLGGEGSVTVPVQISDSSLTPPAFTSACQGSSAPFEPYYNGILGLLFPQYDGGQYYEGNTPVALSSGQLSSSVQNPVFLLSQDNNGVLMSGFPAVSPMNGAPSVSGLLTFGIGTQTGLTQLDTNQYGELTASYAGNSSLTAYFDTGSNGFFIGNATITQCSSSSLSGFFCGSASGQTVTISNAAGTNASVTFSFSIVDAQTLLATGNLDFSSLGGYSAGVFDAGFPAFLTGQTIGLGWPSNTNTTGEGYFLY